jgi:hypothetical protein
LGTIHSNESGALKETTESGVKNEGDDFLLHFCGRQQWWKNFHFQDAALFMKAVNDDHSRLKLIVAVAAIDTHLFQYTEKQKGNRELRNHKNETEPESTSHLCTPFTATILSSVARDSKLAAAFNSTKTYGLDGIMAQLIFQNPGKWKEAETKPLDLRSNMGVVPGLDFEC